MNFNNTYSKTLQLVDKPALIEAIYKEKESVLTYCKKQSFEKS